MAGILSKNLRPTGRIDNLRDNFDSTVKLNNSQFSSNLQLNDVVNSPVKLTFSPISSSNTELAISTTDRTTISTLTPASSVDKPDYLKIFTTTTTTDEFGNDTKDSMERKKEIKRTTTVEDVEKVGSPDLSESKDINVAPTISTQDVDKSNVISPEIQLDTDLKNGFDELPDLAETPESERVIDGIFREVSLEEIIDSKPEIAKTPTAEHNPTTGVKVSDVTIETEEISQQATESGMSNNSTSVQSGSSVTTTEISEKVIDETTTQKGDWIEKVTTKEITETTISR